MKEAELRKHAECSICHEKIGRCVIPRFFVVRVDTYLMDPAAITRQQGLTMQLGGHAALAQVMGPDQDLANKVGDTVTLTVCEHCATTERLLPLMVLISNDDDTEESTA